MDHFILFLVIYATGAAGSVFGHSRLYWRRQLPIIGVLCGSWVAAYFTSDSLIHSQSLQWVPEIALNTFLLSSLAAYIGVPCTIIGWLVGLWLRQWERTGKGFALRRKR